MRWGGGNCPQIQPFPPYSVTGTVAKKKKKKKNNNNNNKFYLPEIICITTIVHKVASVIKTKNTNRNSNKLTPQQIKQSIEKLDNKVF